MRSQIIKDWKFEYEEDWHKAIVPGNNFSDLLGHNFILDPFYGTNEDSVSWVAERKWQYRTSFKTNKDILVKNNQQLTKLRKIWKLQKKYLVINNAF